VNNASDAAKELCLVGLHRSDLDPNPIRQFDRWFQDAVASGAKEPNAMTVATASKGGVPSARILLLKGYNDDGFTFFTNYESPKSRDLAENPQAALVFHWSVLERQIRITGTVTKVSREESAAYFRTRPIGSRIGAWASHQSEVLPSREDLERRVQEFEAQYKGKEVPLPPNWGGYRLWPNSLEFWQGRTNRLHDRFFYTRRADGGWNMNRLSP
jgi:pyridoxamine 5'-phosphate oxidase